MNSYSFQPPLTGAVSTIVKRDDGMYIPLAPGNMTCVLGFVPDWKAGANVTNTDGSAAPYSIAAVQALGLQPA